VTMTHNNKRGDAKILKSCNLPLTGVGVVDVIITDLCVFEVTPDGLVMTEIAPGEKVDEVRERTDARFSVDPDLTIIEIADA